VIFKPYFKMSLNAGGTGGTGGTGGGGAAPNQGGAVAPQGGGVVAGPAAPPIPHLHGGIQTVGAEQAPWTGGGPIGTSGARNGPASGMAFCNPNSIQELVQIKKACSKPLKEASQLGLPNAMKATTMLLQWIHDVQTHLQFNRMDSVFFAIKPTDTDYTDLLTEWHRFDNSEAKTWIEADTWNQYDYDNIQYSGQFLRDSIMVELWNQIKTPFKGNVLGPSIFVVVLQVHQTAGASIV